MVKWTGSAGEWEAALDGEPIGMVWKAGHMRWRAAYRGHRAWGEFVTMTEAQVWVEQQAARIRVDRL